MGTFWYLLCPLIGLDRGHVITSELLIGRDNTSCNIKEIWCEPGPNTNIWIHEIYPKGGVFWYFLRPLIGLDRGHVIKSDPLIGRDNASSNIKDIWREPGPIMEFIQRGGSFDNIYALSLA